jgi:hypothetical protein
VERGAQEPAAVREQGVAQLGARAYDVFDGGPELGRFYELLWYLAGGALRLRGDQTDGSGVRLLVESVTEATDGHATL